MTDLRIGNGIDVHPFDEATPRPLVICGVTVEGAPGLAGHSDADVGAHAVIDAVLGAAGAGDLGSRFGVDDPVLAGANSLDLLALVVGETAEQGWELGNLDLTVVAQRPRLAAHREAMRQNLARACGVDLRAVSVKFTTTDHLGAIGRGEGIAAWCSCLLTRPRR